VQIQGLSNQFKMKNFFFFFIGLLWLPEISVAQNGESYKVQFSAEMNDEKLKLGSYYQLQNGDSIQITALKFYISDIELLLKEKIIFSEENSYHLIDVSESSALLIELKGSGDLIFDGIKFNLGIDSITNFSGALGGELDPTNGMYWTWQNGFINFKLEGKNTQCRSINKDFQFHIGGYQYPFNSLQVVNLNVIGKGNPHIIIDVDQLISEINFSEQDHIMSPGKEALVMAEKTSNIFSISGN
jgi:hypothetical protein